jgi:uncharacterized repeat protein (TIGR03803 family)
MSLPKLLLTFLLALSLATLPLSAQTFTVLHTFTGGTDGASPRGGLIRDSSGNLYGTTIFGGSTGSGLVFKMNKNGKLTVLHAFAGGAGGTAPADPVFRDSAGNLYGTTSSGGLGDGTVFKLDKKNNFTVLYSFNGKSTGMEPFTPVVRDAAGNLYGTTDLGGDTSCDGGGGCGVVFKIDPQGNETLPIIFTGGKNGQTPEAGLLMDGAGNLYGTTSAGGKNGNGTVFKLDTSGNETVVGNFVFARGARPLSNVIQDSQGNFYGTAISGGNKKCTEGCGTVYKMDTSGNEITLYAFTGGADGAIPTSGLVFDTAGNLYGSTYGGGTPGCQDQGCGVIFKLDPTGKETVLHSFSDGADGAAPEGNIVLDTAGNLYGTTSIGGTDNQGVVFKITP